MNAVRSKYCWTLKCFQSRFVFHIIHVQIQLFKHYKRFKFKLYLKIASMINDSTHCHAYHLPRMPGTDLPNSIVVASSDYSVFGDAHVFVQDVQK